MDTETMVDLNKKRHFFFKEKKERKFPCRKIFLLSVVMLDWLEGGDFG